MTSLHYFQVRVVKGGRGYALVHPWKKRTVKKVLYGGLLQNVRQGGGRGVRGGAVVVRQVQGHGEVASVCMCVCVCSWVVVAEVLKECAVVPTSNLALWRRCSDGKRCQKSDQRSSQKWLRSSAQGFNWLGGLQSLSWPDPHSALANLMSTPLQFSGESTEKKVGVQ